MRDTKLIILHFVYHDIDTTGCPAKMVFNYLKAFFKKPKTLFYKEVLFNIHDKAAGTFQEDDMQRLANELMMYVYNYNQSHILILKHTGKKRFPFGYSLQRTETKIVAISFTPSSVLPPFIRQILNISLNLKCLYFIEGL
jgi:hypothetical protein